MGSEMTDLKSRKNGTGPGEPAAGPPFLGGRPPGDPRSRSTTASFVAFSNSDILAITSGAAIVETAGVANGFTGCEEGTSCGPPDRGVDENERTEKQGGDCAPGCTWLIMAIGLIKQLPDW